MSLGADWPTDELRDVLQAHNLRILGRERRRTGIAPWWMRSVRRAESGVVYDPEATWTETHYTFRRDMTCEACSQRFGYNFEVDQVSRVHQSGRGTDGALRHELGRQLRRRIRCPHCKAVQKEPRRMLLSAERKQTGLACSVILLEFLLFAIFGALGGWLGGIVGFFVGAIVALAGVLVLWFFAFPFILSIGPTI